MDILLKVQPDVLISTSNEMSAEKSAIFNIMEEAKSEINSLPASWEGDASGTFQNRFQQIYDDIDKILRVIGEYSSDLNDAAEIYRQAERNAVATAEGLPTQGVFTV